MGRHAKAELYLTGHQRVFWLCQVLCAIGNLLTFGTTEFKAAPLARYSQKFGNLKIIARDGIGHYGLDGAKAPPIQYGTHSQPTLYHERLRKPIPHRRAEPHEATIGHFIRHLLHTN
jgi:hypothetical protein